MLEFNVLHYDWSRKRIEPYNIISQGLLDEIKKQRRNRKINSLSDLKEWLKRNFMYHYWSKSEHEFIIADMHKQDINFKIDKWFQIEPNLDLITRLIAEELNFRFK